MAAAATAAADDLAVVLAKTCQGGDHWCCNDELLERCGLLREEISKLVKWWWGPTEPWLEMLITQVALELGKDVGLSSKLGASWEQAVEVWTDAAYAAACSVPDSSPPQRGALFTQTRPLVRKVMTHVRGVALAEVAVVAGGTRGYRSAQAAQKMLDQRTGQRTSWRKSLTKVETLECESCRQPFSQKLGTCPSCFPRAPPDRKSSVASEGAVEGSASGPAGQDPEAVLQEWRSCPSAPLEEASWSGISGLIWVHGGSGGVGLVRRPCGVSCVKRCLPEELFAQRLATALGVRVAGMRVIEYTSKEANDMRLNVKYAPTSGESDNVPIRRILQHDFLCVMEFVSGVGMMGIPAHNYLRKRQDAISSTPWRDLGRLMAFDMLVNNYDRLPLAWSNEGNLGNVMLGCSVGDVVGIDQCAAPIKHADGLEKYLAKVQRAVHEAQAGEGKAFGAVLEAIFNNTAAQLAPDEIADLRRGCLDFVKEVVDCRGGKFEEVLQEVGREVRCCFAGQLACDEVVESTCSMVRQVVEAMDDVLCP
mmetsp:Transcript_125919/g.403135  ORF Transcript_125919/g.403135 Transcript_125919/m.403135 type:complete len:535 (-) Transcript_125919:34-1638(-)